MTPTEQAQNHRLTTLDSGVRIVTEQMDSVRSAALGIWIGTGSAVESDGQAGLSHLLEHMLFRGTPRYSSLEIDQLFDSLGAEVNAGTGRETTSVYTRVLDRHVPKALDAMAEIVFRPRLDATDLDNEREIVLEEIAMYEDEPQDKVFDVLGEAIYGDHPMGRPIIGRAAVVAETSAQQLREFHDARYVGSNIVVSAAGAVSHDEIVELVRAIDIGPSPAAELAYAEPEFTPTRSFFEKRTEQYHVCLGGPGIDRHDERRFALRVLDTIMGASGSSRLFQEVREKRGLAYSVFSFNSMFARTGTVGIYVGTRPENLERAIEVISAELRSLCDAPVRADELARAKENAKGRMILALESTAARMNRLGSTILGAGALLSVAELERRVDAVTLDDLCELAAELYAPQLLSAAGVGSDGELFRQALEPLCEGLAA